MPKQTRTGQLPDEDKQYDFNMEGWNDAQTIAKELYTNLGSKRTEMKDYEDAYFMDWDKEGGSAEDKTIKVTISPDLRDKVRGATRLITATSPSWELPKKSNAAKGDEKSNRIEKAANLMWTRSNSIQGAKVERDAAFCGFLYDEIIIQIVATQDILTQMEDGLKNAKTKDQKKRWEGEVKHAKEVVAKTPYLYETVSPTSAEIVRGRTGIEYFYVTLEKRVDEIEAEWGYRASRLLGDKKAYDKMILEQVWDRTFRYVWVQGIDRPIYAEPHGLAKIPVATSIPEGSPRLFSDKVARQREPLLYGAIKSNLWKRTNMIWTATMTNAAALLNAQFVLNQATIEDKVRPDHSTVGGIITVPPGAQLKPLVKELVNPEAMGLLREARGVIDQTTIYNQALGQNLEGSDNYSLVSLVAQAGRLPIVGVREGLSTALNNAMQITFACLKEKGSVKMHDRTQETLELQADDIPDMLEFDVKVDVDLPQDKVAMGGVAASLVESGLASKQFARLNFLNMNNSEEEQQQIWKERAGDAMEEMELRKVLIWVAQTKAKMEAEERQKMEQEMAGSSQTQPGQEQTGQPGSGQAQPGQETQAQPAEQQPQPQSAQGAQAQPGQTPEMQPGGGLNG